MNKYGQTICLSMIVKNEAPVITRCLDSVRSIIDYWIIVDTGSTDGTQQVIKDYFKDVPGELHELKWRDFAFNRSQALELSRTKADYSLVIDADDFLQFPADFEMPYLGQNCYYLTLSDCGLSYQRIQLMSNSQTWYYRGVLHEFATCDSPHSSGHLPITMVRNHDGARRRDPQTYSRDAGVLEKALLKEKDPFLQTRYTFYLAQSYRDCQNFKQSIKYYLKRSKMGGWQDEVFYSLYQVGKLKEAMGAPDEEIIEAYENATASMPTRNEARHAASRFCRIKGHYKRGFDIARAGLNFSYPAGCLFGEPGVYDFNLLDEYAVNAYWIGDYHGCLDVCLKLIASGKIPQDNYARVVKNASESSIALKNKRYAEAGVPTPKPIIPHAAYVPPVLTLIDDALFDLSKALKLDEKIEVLDVGASAINDAPVYKMLVDTGRAHLNAFEGDDRHIQSIKDTYGANVDVYKEFLYDGSETTVYLATPESGMTSLLKPHQPALEFFNGFDFFGKIHGQQTVKTSRLDDIKGLPQLDFVKLDIQGAELTVLKNGLKKIKNAVAVQLEVSFVNLYENQPGFGQIDVWMRSKGFVPHCFTEVKRWSIKPTIFENNFRVGGNQLLEGDIVYVRDPLALAELSDVQLKKLATIVHYFFTSTDLCHFILLELLKRGAVEQSLIDQYSKLAVRPV